MESESLLARLVAACIEAEDHPVIEERDEAVSEVALLLQQVVRERLADEWESDERYVALDGIRTLSVRTAGEKALHILGAFYLLEGHGHRMLPVEAELTVEPGAESTVKLGGRESVFELPTSERQFVRGIEGAHWRHSLSLRLA